MLRRPRKTAGLLPILGLALGFGGCANDRNQGSEPRGADRSTASTQASSDANAVRKDDQWLTTEVQAKMFADQQLKQADIDVSIDNQVVTLTGTVPDQATRQRAETVARSIDGVKSVDDNLRITSSDRPAATSGTAGKETTGEAAQGIAQAIGSGWITAKIQAQYFADTSVKGSRVDVDTTNGVVTLSGTVASDAAHKRAVEIARNTDGVKRVDDELRVSAAPAQASQQDTAAEPGNPALRTDEGITTRIQSRYFTSTDLAPRRIDVTTSQGVVTLKGDVRNEGERREAVNIARMMPGVERVTDQLRINHEVAGTSGRMPVVAPAPETGGGGVAAAAKDQWVETKIEAAYFMADDVKASKVDIESRDGVVTLSGTVASEEARQHAVQIAKVIDGVSRVIDHIRVGAARQ